MQKIRFFVVLAALVVVIGFTVACASPNDLRQIVKEEVTKVVTPVHTDLRQRQHKIAAKSDAIYKRVGEVADGVAKIEECVGRLCGKKPAPATRKATPTVMPVVTPEPQPLMRFEWNGTEAGLQKLAETAFGHRSPDCCPPLPPLPPPALYEQPPAPPVSATEIPNPRDDNAPRQPEADRRPRPCPPRGRC